MFLGNTKYLVNFSTHLPLPQHANLAIMTRTSPGKKNPKDQEESFVVKSTAKTSSLEDAKEWNKKHPRPAKTKTSEVKAGPSGGTTASSGTASGAAPPASTMPTAGL
jgi:hypothetical protein